MLKKLVVSLVVLLSCSSVFGQDFSKGSFVYYRSNQDQRENKINFIPVAQFDKFIYNGDWVATSASGDPDRINFYQVKNLVGIKLFGEFSLRYQNEKRYDEKLVGRILKPSSTIENRTGLGYAMPTNFGSLKITNDLTIWKGSLSDHRIELNTFASYKKFNAIHQIYYDYYPGSKVKNWYEKVVFGYSLSKHTALQIRSEWKPGVKRNDMLGVAVRF